MESETIEMCNLSQGILDETLITAIINIQKSTGWSEERCMDAIGIPKEQQKSYHILDRKRKAVKH